MTAEGTLKSLNIIDIVPGSNDRTTFDRDGMYELADSIRANGLAQPITVRPYGLDPNGYQIYQIVAGERRFKACKEILGMFTIDCIVRDLNDEEASALMLTENIGRRDLNPVDEAFAYLHRQETFGWTPGQISAKCGVSADRVTIRLRLCKVRDDILFHVRRGTFPVGHAAMLSVLDYNRQMIAARPVINGGAISARAFRPLVDQLLSEQQSEDMFATPLTGGPLEQPVVQAVKVRLEDIPDEGALPPLTMPLTENHTGAILFSYIETLISAQAHHEARVIGKVLRYLLKTHSVRLPVRATLDSPAALIPIPSNERSLRFLVDLQDA